MNPDKPANTGWSSTSTSLMRRVRDHDETAWRQLVELYLPLIFHWCRSANLQDHDASDISQDVLKAVAKHIGTFERDNPDQSFRAWLATITKHRIVDHLRSVAKRAEAAGGTDAHQLMQQAEDPASEVLTSSSMFQLGDERLLKALEEVRGRCKEETWQAFWRTTVLGEAPYTVAEELGIPLNSVHQASSRLLKRIRKEMES